MFEPGFQKAFAEAIEKQNKEGVSWCPLPPPHTSKVNWDDDNLSDEEQQNCDSCGKQITDEVKYTSDKSEGTGMQPLKGI
ncbi:hypothetical protein CEXT_360431 [Caerostris extrusa]|uniref:Uncharacterized protein n=1 Tax=Caerostris extrusa TaxID=172846 RepID=A0AAV4MIT0_CAEEX|nr:hypothetical protein CEXT_360431 [Caerostris extrusa]